MEVLEHHERWFAELADGAEHFRRTLLRIDLRQRPDAADAAQAARHRPGEEHLPVLRSQILQDPVEALLLPAHQVDERIAGADERVEVRDEARRRRSWMLGERFGHPREAV